MPQRYRVICPECRTEFPPAPDDSGRHICPGCKKDITDSMEVLFQPSAQRSLPRIVALIILVVCAILLLLALAAAYL